MRIHIPVMIKWQRGARDFLHASWEGLIFMEGNPRMQSADSILCTMIPNQDLNHHSSFIRLFFVFGASVVVPFSIPPVSRSSPVTRPPTPHTVIDVRVTVLTLIFGSWLRLTRGKLHVEIVSVFRFQYPVDFSYLRP